VKREKDEIRREDQSNVFKRKPALLDCRLLLRPRLRFLLFVIERTRSRMRAGLNPFALTSAISLLVLAIVAMMG
jgi:hypothetical protein